MTKTFSMQHNICKLDIISLTDLDFSTNYNIWILCRVGTNLQCTYRKNNPKKTRLAYQSGPYCSWGWLFTWVLAFLRVLENFDVATPKVITICHNLYEE